MFHLDLEKNGEVVTLDFVENNSSLGTKWAQALRNEIDRGGVIHQDDRIYNLNDEWHEQAIIARLNNAITTINNHQQFVDYWIQGDTMTQEDSNQLHHYFELMRGENDDPNEYYLNAPRHVKKAIEEFNVQIHRWEDLVVRKDVTGARTEIPSTGRIVVHIFERAMFQMSDDDYNVWTMNWQPGDVCINYCHKGKTILDLYKDGDTFIGDDNITPQSRYSADFNIQWGTGYSDSQLLKLRFWLEKNQNFLASLGYHPDSPKCAIGKGIIGKLVNDPEIERQRIYGATKILGVRYS